MRAVEAASDGSPFTAGGRGGGSLSDAEQVVATRVTLAIASRIASKP